MKQTKEEKAAYDKQYLIDNKERIAIRHKEYRESHKEEIAARDKSYNENRKEEKAAYDKQYRSDNKEKIRKRVKQYTFNNKEKKKQYYLAHKKKLIAQRKQYYIDNKEKIKQYQIDNKEKIKKYNISNADKRRTRFRKWQNKKKKNDLVYKLRTSISIAICDGLKKKNGSKKGISCLRCLSYTIKELKVHLENQFEPWMTWNNRGNYRINTWKDNDTSTWTWQIDHIIPHSKFNYSSMEDQAFKDCWALSNLRPYSAKQNVLDSDRKEFGVVYP